MSSEHGHGANLLQEFTGLRTIEHEMDQGVFVCRDAAAKSADGAALFRIDASKDQSCSSLKEAGIREAPQNLSALIAEVRKGREITITDCGKPVARLVPPRPAEAGKPFRQPCSLSPQDAGNEGSALGRAERD